MEFGTVLIASCLFLAPKGELVWNFWCKKTKIGRTCWVPQALDIYCTLGAEDGKQWGPSVPLRNVAHGGDGPNELMKQGEEEGIGLK
jgi:hypothetical protein